MLPSELIETLVANDLSTAYDVDMITNKFLKLPIKH